MRKETIERVFADAKEKHGMRYTRYAGLAQVTNWVRLKFAAMNLKKFAMRKWEDTHILLQILIFPLFMSKIDSKGLVAKCAEKNTSVNSEKGWPMCLFAVELGVSFVYHSDLLI